MAEPLTFATLQSRALIAVGGADWRGFLQGLITQDVDSLQPGEARFGALLTPQGKISQYYYGVEFAPKDLRLGLIQASDNKIGTIAPSK